MWTIEAHARLPLAQNGWDLRVERLPNSVGLEPARQLVTLKGIA